MFSPASSALLEIRIQRAIAHIAAYPGAAPCLTTRPDIRMFSLVRYPFKIYYRARRSSVLILHIRHASRRPWKL
ncbi:type II toxin-antitoxin system RelE/ParE family toxin [Variibacter gotjawalensis]|uniref:type II toxin-antitoxin system RelE/ParE family toxin n=1 Tax=Variibacter gotjawalensis TaxID=1333996 RepID=UPI003D311325